MYYDDPFSDRDPLLPDEYFDDLMFEDEYAAGPLAHRLNEEYDEYAEGYGEDYRGFEDDYDDFYADDLEDY